MQTLITAPLTLSPPLDATTTQEDARSAVPIPVVLKVIAICLFLPEEASFEIAGLRLTAIRAIFIFLTPFLLVKLGGKLAAKRYRFVLSDLFVPLAGVWMIIGPANIIGTGEALTHGGPIILEFCVGYLATRALLSGHGQALSFADFLCRVIAVVALLGLGDTLTHHFLIRDLVSKMTGYSKGFDASSYDVITRMGVLRAASTLEHPIAFGLVCAIGFIFSTYLPIKARRFIIPACILGVFSSITSVAIQGVIFAAALVKYNQIMAGIRFRWFSLISLAIFAIIMVFTLVDNPLGFIFRHLIFDQESGYFRLYTWDMGIAALKDSPWFGLGFEVPEYYELPYTIDTVWLVSALTFGIPGAVLIALSIIGAGSISTSGPCAHLRAAESKLGTMLGIVIFLIVFWGFTVHYWGTDWVLIALLIGVRAHLGELGRAGNPR